MRLTRLLVPLLAALLLGAGASPALAHDVLATSDPQEGDVLDAVPAAVTLVYSGEVKTLGTKVVVTGPSGDVQEGSPTVDRMVVKQPLRPGSPAGAYTVTWRVTSSDGHPISGVLHFTVRGGASASASTGGAPTSAPGSTSGTAGTSPAASSALPPATAVATTTAATSTSSPAAATSATPAPGDPAPSRADRTGLWIMLAGAALLAAAGVAWLSSRRR